MIGQIKQRLFRAARSAGVARRIGGSEWRRKRLLVLAYHGLALRDEHRWNPSLFFPEEGLRRRFERLREAGATVLPLAEGLERLEAGTLPPRAVCLTFDDGNRDFLDLALPLLEAFEYPATVYVTTFYSGFGRPVFDVMAPYLLWKGRPRQLALDDLLPIAGSWDLADPVQRSRLWGVMVDATKGRLCADRKDDVLHVMAERLGLDYADLLDSRMFQIMTPDEIEEAHRRGATVELHTHRHRVPWREADMAFEIRENERLILEATGRRPRHFCYPSGEYRLEVVPWLARLGVASAVTCVPGLATRGREALLTPRFVDSSDVPDETFLAWVDGTAALLPRRSHAPKVRRPPSTADSPTVRP